MRVSCVICSDLFDGIKAIVAGSCGHVFHDDCINQWFDRSRTCPECRNPLKAKCLTRLYFNIVPNELSSDYLENRISELEARINERNVEMCKVRSESDELREYVRIAEQKAMDKEQEVYRLKSEATNMRLALKEHKKTSAKVDELEILNKTLLSKLDLFQNVQTVIAGTQKDVEDILQGTISGPDAAKDMATYCSLLKRELLNASSAKQQLKEEIAYLRKNNVLLSVSKKQLSEENAQFKGQILSLEKENSFLITKQVNSASTTSKDSNKATVSYESPPPERLRKEGDEDDDDDVIVTPVSQRLNPNSLKRSKTFSYEKQLSFPVPTYKKPRADINKDLKTIIDSRKSIEENNKNSTIRKGYDGMGGHSKFILQTKNRNFKQPSKKR